MEEEIKKTIKALKEGKTILYPTDTVWGIGCDATNQKAVKKVYSLKKRYEHKCLIVLLCSADQLKNYVEHVPEVAYDLIESIKTPLTIIYSNAKGLAKNVIAKDKSIAIRIIRDEFCKRIISGLGKPLVSTSANISGEKTPLLFSQVNDEIKKEVDYIVKLEQHSFKNVKPSKIIQFEENGEFKIIRQ
ncbi:MAG: threonylcarbamoyl-AMP synthase [Bacteroidales bacterium]|nr:threonylcarbamoyl-AMP synthase [Bacteroidales bacterium]